MEQSLSGSVPSKAPSLEEFMRVASGMTDVANESPAPGSVAAAEQTQLVSPGMEPWKSIDVEAYMPFAMMALKFPFKKIADVTEEPQWQVSQDEADDLKVPLTRAVQKLTYDLSLERWASNPYISLLVAIAGMCMLKWMVIQAAPTTEEEKRAAQAKLQSPRQPIPWPQQPAPDSQSVMPAASTVPSGVISRSEGAYFYADPQGAEKLPSFDNGFMDAAV